MRGILNTIVGKCTLAFEATDEGIRLTGAGVVGVLAVAILIWFIFSHAPDLVHFIVSK
jgi:hypothetical protein